MLFFLFSSLHSTFHLFLSPFSASLCSFFTFLSNPRPCPSHFPVPSVLLQPISGITLNECTSSPIDSSFSTFVLLPTSPELSGFDGRWMIKPLSSFIAYLNPSVFSSSSLSSAAASFAWMWTCRTSTSTSAPPAAGLLGLIAVISPVWRWGGGFLHVHMQTDFPQCNCSCFYTWACAVITPLWRK